MVSFNQIRLLHIKVLLSSSISNNIIPKKNRHRDLKIRHDAGLISFKTELSAYEAELRSRIIRASFITLPLLDEEEALFESEAETSFSTRDLPEPLLFSASFRPFRTI